jgi:hypothetical protein
MNSRSKGKRRHPAPQQFEVRWPEPESFALITQHAIDGDRVAREAQQRAANQEASERQQTQFPLQNQ